MAYVSPLFAASTAMWAFILGALLAPHRSTRPARRRLVATVLVSVWLTFSAASLWRDPPIEPLWLQYTLVIALPAAVGFTIASIAERSRTTSSAPPTADTPAAPDETAEGGIR